VTHIETRGKPADHFSHNLTLYSHNQLYGVWRVVDADEQPQTNRVLRVRLQTADKAILLYSASDIEMLTPEQLAFIRSCCASGRMCWICADGGRCESPFAVAQIPQSAVFRSVLDQAFLAGLGNYLRVEILWEVGLAPQHKRLS
jgi:endonuclease-8